MEACAETAGKHPSVVRVTVECYAGYKADETPRAFSISGERRRILGVSDRWYGPSAEYFKVRADDGNGYLLRHDLETHDWDLVNVSPGHG